MGYMQTLGDTGVEPGVTWNSTKVSGVCKPSDFATLHKFQELQRQINRVAHMKKTTKVAVDGDLGTATIKAFNAAIGANITSCSSIATTVTLFTSQLRSLADSLAAPASVSGPAPVTPPSIVRPDGSLVPAPPGAGTAAGAMFWDLGVAGKVAAVGIAGGIGYLLLTNKKKRRR